MAEQNRCAAARASFRVHPRVQKMPERQSEDQIGDHAVEELDGDRVVDEIGPERLQSPQDVGRRNEDAVHQRPSVVDEARPQSSDEAAHENLQKHKSEDRQRDRLQPTCPLMHERDGARPEAAGHP